MCRPDISADGCSPAGTATCARLRRECAVTVGCWSAVKPYYEDKKRGVVIYHGDCRDVVASLPRHSADVLLSDPPYGMAYKSADKKAVSQNVKADGARQGARIVRQMLGEWGRASKPEAHAYLFCHWESWPDFYDMASGYLHMRNALVWWKDRGSMGNMAMEYARDYEVILYAAPKGRPLVGGRRGAVIDGHPPVPSARRLHPTEKPVSLLRYLVERSAPKGGLVLDPFMGSGSTLEAANSVGRRAIGIELDERYCELAANRIRTAGSARAA
jgi:DNA modification methylase